MSLETAPRKDIATRSCKLRLDVRPDRMDDRYLKVLTIPTKELDAP